MPVVTIKHLAVLTQVIYCAIIGGGLGKAITKDDGGAVPTAPLVQLLLMKSLERMGQQQPLMISVNGRLDTKSLREQLILTVHLHLNIKVNRTQFNL